ncbi:hypothetical protein Ddye_023414 [Dipteronia dyeriana]|uniref:MULE transposase domain-containing protein n=1 Tax=Dipteronia dyeriana TaxID=168575 RepID=A0AAD9TT15_9ROSI|nr:hypothetical protein Ddye_023414 [Dipteronia dyeriana]
MALGACTEGFNTVTRQVIVVDATHLKSKTRGVLLVVVCKDGNEMIYPLAFGFANFECSKSWTCFLKQLRGVILQPEHMLIVSDRHTGISNAMKLIFPDAAHGFYAYHLANNLKQHCRKRSDVINLYYHATYAHRVEEFDRLMVEMKSIHSKVHDELVEVGIQKFSCVHYLRKRAENNNINYSRNTNGMHQDESGRQESIFQCLRERIANAESTFSDERANAERLTIENQKLIRKVDNLEAKIINFHVQMEARDNELNGLYNVVENL